MEESNVKPLLLAIAIALIATVLNAFVPEYYIDETTGQVLEVTEPIEIKIDTNKSKSGDNKTENDNDDNKDKSVKEDIVEKVEVSLDAKAYINMLPFKLSEKDEKTVLSHFSDIASALSKNEKEIVTLKIRSIEALLKPYWFSDKLKEKYTRVEIDKSYLLKSDFEMLSKDLEHIKEMGNESDLEELFAKISSFNKAFYQAQNNVLKTYKKEIEENKIMQVEVLSNTLVQKQNGLLTDDPKFDYSAFLMSRAFEISAEDTDKLYYKFVKLNGSKAKTNISLIHTALAPYWFKSSTINTLVPFDLYKDTTFRYLSDEEIDKLNDLHDKILSQKSKDGADELIHTLTEFNRYLGDVISEQYKDVYTSFDLKNIIYKKGE